jgi:hypothetical protein
MGPGLEIQMFDRLTVIGRRFFFRLVDCGNNEILAASQTYKTELQRNKTARRIAEGLGCHLIERKSR